MAKSSDKRTVSLSSEADELCNLLVDLYNKKLFVRAGKDLANNLFEIGLEAGSLLAAIDELPDKAVQYGTANQAMLKLTQTLYILDAMQRADFYTEAEIKKLSQFLEKTIDTLKRLLVQIRPAEQRVMPVAAPQQPVVVHSNPQPTQQVVAKQVINEEAKRPQPVSKNAINGEKIPEKSEQIPAKKEQISTKNVEKKQTIQPEPKREKLNCVMREESNQTKQMPVFAPLSDDDDGLNDYVEISPELLG
jgi:hypothetical protein